MNQTGRPVEPAREVQGRSVLMVLILVMLLGFWLTAYSLERVSLDPFFVRWLGGPITGLLPRPMIVMMEMFHWRVLRHFLPVTAGIYLAYRAAVGLVKTLYDLPVEGDATQFLQRLRAASPAGINPVALKSRTLEAERPNSIVLRVGGPAKVKVAVGDVAVTELNGRFQQVLGAGTHTLGRFETVHSVIDLHPQERTAADIILITKDGLELTADLTIRFRIKQGDPPTTETPFTFVDEAVRQAAYFVRLQDDQSDTWETLPLKQARQLLYATVAQFNLDEILEPATPHTEPYLAIHTVLDSELKKKLDPMGLELLSIHIGRLELPTPVLDQVIDYWQSHWENRRHIVAAEGEAEALEEIDMARAQAEIMMIKAIVEGVKLAREQGRSGDMRHILALRLIEALEGMTRHSQEAGSVVGPLTGPLAEEILPRLTDMRRQVARPYLNERNDEGKP
jgi:regulator of protease activity HflC (stomatin/prohibitin superfamily)